MEYHRHIAGPNQDTSLCIAAFYCDAPALALMAHRTFILDDTRRRALSEALKYATDIFSSLVDAQDVLYLVKKPDVSEVQEQLFTNSLKVFSCSVHRRQKASP